MVTTALEIFRKNSCSSIANVVNVFSNKYGLKFSFM